VGTARWQKSREGLGQKENLLTLGEARRFQAFGKIAVPNRAEKLSLAFPEGP